MAPDESQDTITGGFEPNTGDAGGGEAAEREADRADPSEKEFEEMDNDEKHAHHHKRLNEHEEMHASHHARLSRMEEHLGMKEREEGEEAEGTKMYDRRKREAVIHQRKRN